MPSFGTVIFDCDSTLSLIEGVEELSGPDREAIAELTQTAMDGSVPLEQVYRKRLELVRPTRQAVEALGKRYVETLVPGAREAVHGLMAMGVQVRIISGGLRAAVEQVALHLGLDCESVAAVDVFWGADGAYTGFDAASPLAKAGGKAEVIRGWSAELPGPIMLVGDGATDLEAKPAVDMFVAFTGVVDRPAVRAGADAVLEGPSLLPLLDLLRAPKPDSR